MALFYFTSGQNIFVPGNSTKIGQDWLQPRRNEQRVGVRTSFVWTVRSALRDALNEYIEPAAQMDGATGMRRQSNSRESSIIHESW